MDDGAHTFEVVRYRDEFYPRGFRKIAAMMIIFAVTVLPTLFAWQYSPDEGSAAPGFSSSPFGAGGGFVQEGEAPRSDLLGTLWTGIKRLFVTFVVALGLMLYYPRRGFKRYSLLCAPLIAFLVPACLAGYLQNRTEVYRVELVLVNLFALAPGVGLYVFLTWRKARKLGMEW